MRNRMVHMKWVIVILFLSMDAMSGGGGISQIRSKYRLSNLVEDKDLSGLTLESVPDRALLEEQVQEYTQFRLGRLPSDRLKTLLHECELPLEVWKNPFCPYFLRPLTRRPIDQTFETKSQRRRRIHGLHHQLSLGKLEVSPAATEADLSQALKKISKKKTDSLVKKALAEQTCPSSPLLTALGLKVEDDLPHVESKELSVQLYRRAIECDPQNIPVLASYRLGLMQIWDGHCDQAESLLSKIHDSSATPDYKIRAAYWRHYCANELKNSGHKEELRDWLVKEYPFSLHTLLVKSDHAFQESAFTEEEISHDPEVSFRSVRNPELNSYIRAAEALIAQRELSVAGDLLASTLPRFLAQKDEPALQIYFAVMLKRVRAESGSFQVMATVLKLHPKWTSRRTLEFMYPLRQLDVIQEHDETLDPFLVLSLIRQESAFDENAKSSAGAMGLTQLQLATARRYEKVSRQQLYDPQVNVRIGVKYFKRLIDLYDGNVGLALAAYNAGPGRLAGFIKRYPVEKRLLFWDLLPVRETRDYVTAIARNYYWYRRLYTPLETGHKIADQGHALLQSFLELHERVPSGN